jgi:hypothetical protein
MITTDKMLHFLAGFFIVTVFQFSLVVMIVSVIIIGGGKELYDLLVKRTKFDIVDLACTIAGGFIAYWIMLIYK